MPLPEVIRQRMQPLNAVVTSNRIALYSVFSTFAVAAAIANACRNHSNFYSVAIFLSKSSRSVLVLANFGFLFALLCGQILQRLFFGPLQPREVERLYDQTWMFVTESLLAFTIFRDEFDIPFILMFGFLLFIKCFHWLMADRVESMDQTTYPGPPTLFHIRMNSLFCLLWVTDLVMFGFAVESTLTNGVGGMVLFASEYAILMASAINAMARYVLSIVDLRRARTRGGENAPLWENKSMYVFYIELVTDFLKLATYLTFFMIILTFYGLPLNIIRDVYLTARSFITRLRALVRYHNATRDMDRRYPNAMEAELSEMSDRTCIICREEMVARAAAPAAAGHEQDQPAAPAPAQADGPNVTPKKLPCGHIFHFQCLRSWLERQQSCPTCRRTVLETVPQNPAQAQGRQGVPGPPPAAPQPGMVPQAPLPGQPAAGGALGWVNRFLGAGAQPPAPEPGQFAVPGVPAQQPGHAGWVPAQPPIAYYYPVGYAPYQPQAPAPHLQQAPVFRGFYGPGGVWQPWGVDPQLHPDGANQPAQAPGLTQPPAQPTPVAAPARAPDGVSNDQARPQGPLPPADNLTPTPTATTPVPAPVLERSSSAREAAALAAERRMNGAGPTAASQSATPMPVPDSSSTSDAAGRAGTPPPADIPTSSAPPSSPSAATASSSASEPAVSEASPTHNASESPDTRQAAPPLIPLHDFASSYAMRQPLYTMAPVNPYGHTSPYFRGQPPSARPQPGTAPQPPRYARGAAPARAPVTQLPATLTEEQLGRLDRITREAIDERIRLLENVSGAVYRCIEELTRVRSVLPAAAADAGRAAEGAPSPAGSSRDAAGAGAGPASGSAPRSDADVQRESQSGGPSTVSTPAEEDTPLVPVQ